MAKNDGLTGVALEKALKAGELEERGTEIVGMVKASERAGHVAFSAAGCDAWVDLPTPIIEDAQKLGSARCRDHSHPVFRLKLSEGKSPEARAFAELLAAMTPTGRPLEQATQGLPYGPPAAMAQSDFGTADLPGMPMAMGRGSGLGDVPGGTGGVSALAITYCRNPRWAWAIPNTICADCAVFRIRCIKGYGCFWEQVTPWSQDCFSAGAIAERRLPPDLVGPVYGFGGTAPPLM
jgi:hypothetical protein